jgi:hypothetical protein
VVIQDRIHAWLLDEHRNWAGYAVIGFVR